MKTLYVKQDRFICEIPDLLLELESHYPASLRFAFEIGAS
jgi:hypothetical protein